MIKEYDIKSIFTIISQGKIQKIYLSNIYLIECMYPYLHINCVDNKDFFIQTSLKYLESVLPPDFIRINKSQIVNVFFIQDFSSFNQKAKLKLYNEIFLDVSRRKISVLRKRITGEIDSSEKEIL